jgi:hypothetical protein
MVGLLGADLAGMSTVPEAIAAVHQGARVLAFSCVTNLAAGRSPTPLCHSEVTEVAARSRGRFRQLLAAVLSLLAAEAQAGGGYEGDTGNNRGNASTGAGEAGNTGRTRDGGRSEGTDGPGEPR